MKDKFPDLSPFRSNRGGYGGTPHHWNRKDELAQDEEREALAREGAPFYPKAHDLGCDCEMPHCAEVQKRIALSIAGIRPAPKEDDLDIR